MKVIVLDVDFLATLYLEACFVRLVFKGEPLQINHPPEILSLCTHSSARFSQSVSESSLQARLTNLPFSAEQMVVRIKALLLIVCSSFPQGGETSVQIFPARWWSLLGEFSVGQRWLVVQDFSWTLMFTKSVHLFTKTIKPQLLSELRELLAVLNAIG